MSSATSEPSRRRTRLSAVDRQETRELLVQAAIRTFSSKAYINSSVTDITVEAGASRATFYLHFGAKSDLLEELISRAGTEFTQPYENLIPILRTHDWDGFRPWILEAMRRWARIEDFMRPVFEAANADSELYSRFFPDDAPGVTSMTQILLESGYVEDPGHAGLYAVLYSPLLHFFRRYLQGEKLDFETISETLGAAWVDVLQGAIERL